MSGRPIGPKKVAALEQLAAMRAKGVNDTEIRETLIKSGLSKVQALEIVPRTDAEKRGLPAPMIERPPDDEMKAAVIDGAIHFLNGIALRVTPNVIDRFPELGSVRHDALTWGRKLKGAL